LIQIHAEAAQVQDRLTQLGLEQEPIADIVRRGYLAFASCTPNHPPMFPGLSSWATMVVGLREYLLPEWSRCDDNNYPLVVNAEGTVAIAVATGDEATGVADATPTTKSVKGPSTVEAVISNQVQLELPLDLPMVEAPGSPIDIEKRITWILLVHRSLSEVRFELSLPTSMNAEGRVDGWRERIILGAIPLDPVVLDITTPQSPLPDIDVEVKRRA